MSKGKTDKAMGLQGKFFHSFKEKKVGWQGCVISEVRDGFFLVQLFEWITGTPSCQKLVRIEEMVGWDFYDTEKEMKNTYQNKWANKS